MMKDRIECAECGLFRNLENHPNAMNIAGSARKWVQKHCRMNRAKGCSMRLMKDDLHIKRSPLKAIKLFSTKP